MEVRFSTAVTRGFFFSLEVARYLIDHSKGKKTLWHPGYAAAQVALNSFIPICISNTRILVLSLFTNIMPLFEPIRIKSDITFLRFLGVCKLSQPMAQKYGNLKDY